jgi:hypothetical protein
MPQAFAFKPLPLNQVKQAPHLRRVQRQANAHDAALSLLTDLHQGPCVVASHRDGLDETLHLMVRCGVHMVFVAGADGELVGMVAAGDIQGERPVLRAATDQVPHRELTLLDVMVPVSQWLTVDLGEVRHARLGDVAATLHEHGLRYLLVTQLKDGETTLRGLFSARRLELALQTAIEPDLHSRSFAELEQVLAH